jgi:hypothetical protein
MARGRGGRRKCVAGAAALLALAVLVLPASAAPTWLLPAATVSDAKSINPAVAADAAGNVVALWSRDTGSSDYVLEARAHSVGGSWGTVDPLGPAGAYGVNPKVALDRGGNAFAIWSNGGIQAAVRPTGGAWGPSQTLSGGTVDAPYLAVNATGDAVALWRRFPDASLPYTVQAAFRRGGAWQAPQTAFGVSGKQVFPLAVAIDSAGNAAALWIYYDSLTSRKLQVSYRAAGAADWETPVDLTSYSATCCGGDLGFDAAGNALAVFGDGGTIKSSQRAGPAGAWSAPQSVGSGEEPQLAVGPTGDAAMIWTFSGTRLNVATRPAPTGVWSAPKELATNAEEAYLVDVAVDGAGRALVAWVVFESSRHHVLVSRGTVATNSWENALPISIPGAEAAFPTVALDSAGNGVVAFMETSDPSTGPYFIRAAPLDVAGPIFSGFSIPSTATAGTSVPFAVGSADAWSPLAPGPYWDFGDGTFALGTNVTHTYASPGTYTVSVTHADAVANTTTATGTVAVAAKQAPPAARPVARCVVPKVVARKLARAKAAIKKAHCRTGKVRRAYSKKRRKGLVVAQSPRAGRKLKAGTRVNLVVSRGRKPKAKPHRR